MPFQKGQSGNPHGRPKLGDSLAEQIRKALAVDVGDGKGPRVRQLIEQQIILACEPHRDVMARQKAAEWLAKHGWPEAGRSQVKVQDETKTITVTWATEKASDGD